MIGTGVEHCVPPQGRRALRILGTRGVPAAHGGFETFAEHLALFLVERGWQVTVYCQEEGDGPAFQDTWRGVRRVRMPISTSGAAGTVVFDLKSTLHAVREKELVLTLGYNTALFCTLYRLFGLRNVINMDGIEWHRQKWGLVAKTWFWLNDWAGCWLGNHLVADHPEIKRHLETRVRDDKITMIPYGADCVTSADASLLKSYGLTPGDYAILIARAEPENSILEVVSAWSRRARNMKLVVLGKYESSHAYQRAVQAAASSEVLFPGAIYDKAVVQALRFHARFYVHGHRVGGTNPSLVEALGAGNAVLAHDNRFNRWVAGPEARYFSDENDCAKELDDLLADADAIRRMGNASRRRHEAEFTWPKVLRDYEVLMERFVAHAGKGQSS
jgi:glycosyltransferase involved in cell wall biosynthesis